MTTKEKAFEGEALPSHFVFHHDAAHGWLEVPFNTIIALDLKKQISGYSYQSGNMVYLEEDLDAPLFIRAYLKKVGRQGDHAYFTKLCSSAYEGQSSYIRNFRRYDRGERKPSFSTQSPKTD